MMAASPLGSAPAATAWAAPVAASLGPPLAAPAPPRAALLARRAARHGWAGAGDAANGGGLSPLLLAAVAGLGRCRLAPSFLAGARHTGGRRGARPRRGAAAGQGQDNLALVFVKPHACTPEILRLVPEFLRQRGCAVVREGSVAAAEIDQGGIIDAHYAAIARVGMAKDLGGLGLGAGEGGPFLAAYGRPLEAALAAGEVHSAVSALEVLGTSPSELLERCLAAGYAKLRSGLYCARLEGGDGRALYVLNGFYARMREKFVAPGVVVHWLVVRFSAEELPWSAFRSGVIGATQPSDAASGSLRARIRDEWRALGLKEETNYQDNGVHASAGPLEALRERVIWLGEDPAADPFGAALRARVGAASLEALLENPVVDMGGRRGGAFELLEDADTGRALDLLAACAIAGA